jgi:hypothetical protein
MGYCVIAPTRTLAATGSCHCVVLAATGSCLCVDITATNPLCFGSNWMLPTGCCQCDVIAVPFVVFWQQLDAANAHVIVMAATECGRRGAVVVCYGSNQMRPNLAATECGQSDVLSSVLAAQKWAVFWQQPNAAKAMCY